MTRPALAPRDRASALLAGRRIAAELADAAVDPAARLTMADRMALATLSLAVEAEVARMAGADPPDHPTRSLGQLAAVLAGIEAAGP